MLNVKISQPMHGLPLEAFSIVLTTGNIHTTGCCEDMLRVVIILISSYSPEIKPRLAAALPSCKNTCICCA